MLDRNYWTEEYRAVCIPENMITKEFVEGMHVKFKHWSLDCILEGKIVGVGSGACTVKLTKAVDKSRKGDLVYPSLKNLNEYISNARGK